MVKSTDSHYVLGLDIGQAADYTALALLEHDREQHPTYRVRALHRFPLGTPYTQFPGAIKKRLAATPLSGRTRTAIDATGVGGPVIDLFKEHLPRAQLYAITITAGATVSGTGTRLNVPKRDLITTTSLILEQRRLRIAADLPATQTLLDELLNYRRTTSEAGHDSYAAAGNGHDDLVVASLALWTAEHKPIPQPYRSSRPKGRLPTIDEIIRSRQHRHLPY